MDHSSALSLGNLEIGDKPGFWQKRGLSPISLILVGFLVAFCSVEGWAAIDGKMVLDEAARALESTGGRECVHEAVSQLVELQDVEVVGAGSHIKGNYVPGSSDHDFTLRLREQADDVSAIRQWKTARARLAENVRSETQRRLERTLRQSLHERGLSSLESERIVKEMLPDIENKAGAVARDFMSRTSLYPPAQLVADVDDAAGAARRFKELGATPSLGREISENMTVDQLKKEFDGIWGKGGLPFRQGYEETSGRVWYKETVVGKDGSKVTRVKSGFADLPHFSEGYGRYTADGTASTARQWGTMAGEALEKGDYRTVFKDIERAHLDLKKCRDLSTIPTPQATPYKEFVDDLQRIKQAAADLPPAQRTAYLNRSMQELFETPGYRDRLASALKHGQQEAELLQVMAGSRSGMRRAVIREMLEGSSHPAQELWDKIRAHAGAIPIEYILIGLFTYWDTVDSASRAGTGDVDGAARKALEALMTTLTGIGPSLLITMTNLVIDAAKDAGYALAVSVQDCEDLLAGIVAVKGWQSADSFGSGGETNIDQLARNVVDEERIKNIIETAIANAGDGSTDIQQVLQGKTDALRQRCQPQIIGKWRDRRRALFNDYLDTLAQIDQLVPQLSVVVGMTPASPKLLKRKDASSSARINFEAQLVGPIAAINELLDTAALQVAALGGSRNKTLFDPYYQISWKGMGEGPTETGYRPGWPRDLNRFSVTVDRPGILTFTCDVTLNLRIQSTITDGADYTFQEFAIIERLFRGELPGYETRHIQGDVIASNDRKSIRAYSLAASGEVAVEESDRDDSLAVTLDAPTYMKPGEAALVMVVLDSAEEIDPGELDIEWRGVRPLGKLEALFKQERPGKYPVQAKINRNRNGRTELFRSEEVFIEVLDTGKAIFSMEISGPEAVSAGKSFSLLADVDGRNPAGEALLADRDVYLRWSVNGEVLDTGRHLPVEGGSPGDYTFLLELVDERTEQTKILASAKHRLVIKAGARDQGEEQTGAEAAAEHEGPKETEHQTKQNAETGGDEETAEHQRTAPVQAVDPRAPPAEPAQSAGEKQAGTIMYGSTLTLNFGESPQKSSGAESNRDFEELSRKAAEKYRDELNRQKLPSAIDISEAERLEEERSRELDRAISGSIRESTGAPDDDETIRDPDLPPDAETDRATAVPESSPPLPAQELHVGPAAPTARPGTDPANVPPGDVQKRYRYVFQSSPNLTFTPPESSDGSTSVVVDRLEELRIWAEIHDLSNPQAATRRSVTYVYNVTPPAFQVTCDQPPALVGQEARVRVTATPALPEALVDYVWLEPSVNMKYSGNSSEIGFTMRSPDPVTVKVHARVPFYGTALGTAGQTCQPALYTVTVSNPVRLGPAVRVWSEAAKGLVEVPGAIATFQNVEVQASVTPPPPSGELRYRWQVSPDGCSISAPSSSTTRLNASQMGQYTVTVTVTDQNGVELGSGSGSFAVTNSQAEIDEGLARQQTMEQVRQLITEAKEQWARDEKEQAVSTIHKALNLAPGHNEARAILGGWQAILDQEKERYDELIRQGFSSESSGRIEQAIDLYRQSQEIVTDSKVIAHIAELEERLHLQKAAEKRVAELLQQGHEQEKKGNLEEAVDRYQESLQINDDTVVKGRIEELKRQIRERQDKEQAQQRFAELLNDGYERERSGDLKGALSRYQEAELISPDTEVAKRIKLLEGKLQAGTTKDRAAAEQREEQFATLLKQGYGKEQAGDLNGAIRDYKSALAIRNDDNVVQRVDHLQRSLEKKAGTQRTAMAPRNDTAARKPSPEPGPPSRKPPVPWSGTYEARDATEDGHTETFLTLRLVQRGNDLAGEMVLKIFTQGSLYSNETVSVSGSCRDAQAAILVEGDSLNLTLSSDGNSIATTDGIRFKRVR